MKKIIAAAAIVAALLVPSAAAAEEAPMPPALICYQYDMQVRSRFIPIVVCYLLWDDATAPGGLRPERV